MAYFFPMPSEINLPWMCLTVEHHRKGSNNGLSLRKNFLEYSILCYKLILLKKEDYS